MEKYFDVLESVSLFNAINKNELESMLRCLDTQIIHVKKNEVVLLAGNCPKHVGIVLSGQLHIVKDDYEGNHTLVAAVTSGEIFAEALCCAGVKESPVTVMADTDSAIMLLRFERILHSCPHSCDFHTKLIENMLEVMAKRNLMLQNRINILGAHSVREKVMRYLESFIPKQGREIQIPFNREGLANYLCVERSALSHELSRMKKDGLIDYKKNLFILN